MRLYFLRHAQALRDAPSGRDADRPLSDFGRQQARFIAGLFAHPMPPQALQPRPLLILASPAERAASTAATIADALGLPVTHEDAISLHATFNGALALVDRLLDDARPALLIGHNPTLSDLIDHLAHAAPLGTGELSALTLVSDSRWQEVGRFRHED